MTPCRCRKRAVCFVPEPLCETCAAAYYTALVQVGAELSRARFVAAAQRELEVDENRQRPCRRCPALRATGHGRLCARCLLTARRYSAKGA